MVLLPAVVMARFQHEYALYLRSRRGALSLSDLTGQARRHPLVDDHDRGLDPRRIPAND